MSKPHPCRDCPDERECLTGCQAWKEWICDCWDGYNRYANAHGLKIEKLEQKGDE